VSWKPTALAAVVVAIVGVAAGAAIGGHTTVRTKYVNGSSAAPGVSATATPSARPEPSAGPVPTPVPLTADDVKISTDTISSDAYDETATIEDAKYRVPVELQTGESKEDSMQFRFGTAYESHAADYYELQLAVPNGATHFMTTIGFLKGDASSNHVDVTFYRREYAPSTTIRRYPNDSSEGGQPVDLDVKGLSLVIVRFVCKNEDRVWRTPQDLDPMFGLQSPQFTFTA